MNAAPYRALTTAEEVIAALRAGEVVEFATRLGIHWGRTSYTADDSEEEIDGLCDDIVERGFRYRARPADTVQGEGLRQFGEAMAAGVGDGCRFDAADIAHFDQRAQAAEIERLRASEANWRDAAHDASTQANVILAQRDAAEARAARLELDALRYRWLRDDPPATFCVRKQSQFGQSVYIDGDTLDLAIDTARAALTPAGGAR